MKRVVLKCTRSIIWTGSTGGEIIKQIKIPTPQPHEVAESEEKDTTKEY